MFSILKRLFSRQAENRYIYGYKGTRPARIVKKTGKLQIILWKAGEQGWKYNKWHNAGDGHIEYFKPLEGPPPTWLIEQLEMDTKRNYQTQSDGRIRYEE
jgi:hypothetical protein